MAQEPAYSIYDVNLARVLQNPADPELTFDYAMAAVETGRVREAIAALERLLVANPQLSNIRFELGLLYLRTGSTQLGQQLVADALSDPTMPADVRARAEDVLEEAQVASRRWSLSGYAAVGVRHDSNANSGPAGFVQFVIDAPTPVEVEGALDPEDTGQPDWSSFALLSGEARYDLWLQAGHELVFSGNLYLQRYAEQTQLDLAYAGVSGGVDFNLTPALGRLANLQLDLTAATANRDRDAYLDEYGVSLDGNLWSTEQLRLRGSFGLFYQDFRNSPAYPTNDDQDGTLASVTFGASYLLSPATEFTALGYLSDKSASEEFEAYQEVGAFVSVNHLFPGPFANAERFWEAGLLADYSYTRYDDLDDSVELDEKQRDNAFRIEGSLGIPAGERATVVTRAGYYSNDSNFEIDTYDNLYASVELGVSF